ncbi:MAG: serine/threonine-protein kinase [Kofleriaceae bacterium]
MAKAPAGTGALIGQRLGKYEVLALLALGGTAEIYLARIGGAAGFEKFVVIKCLHEHLADDAEFVSMVLDEARLAAQLDHSNIVQTFELGEWQGRYFMALEFLGGLSLAMMVRRVGDRTPDGKIPVALALNIVQQACAGLHYAHERRNGDTPLNVVHRDISPQNLVVTFEGMVKLVDFGIARADQRETRTRAGTIKGKFAYMSPEQCVSNAVDRRTDVFALGVVLYELITGKRLFKRANQYDTYQAVIECAVPAPSTQNPALDRGVDALVLRALAKDKERRYPTAEAFGDAILRYLHQRNVYAGPSEVGRFMEATYAAELAEHAARMRELLDGRRGTDDGADWDEEVEGEVVEPSTIGALIDDREPAEAAAASAARAQSDVTGEIETGDLEVSEGEGRGRTGSAPIAAEADDDGGEATRIEMNLLLEGRGATLAGGVAAGGGASGPTRGAERPPVAASEPAVVPTVIVPADLAAEACRGAVRRCCRRRRRPTLSSSGDRHRRRPRRPVRR